MALRMVRRNVLIDLGELVAPWESEVIVCPDSSKRTMNVMGKIKDVATGCMIIGRDAIGKGCLIEIGGLLDDRRIRPGEAEAMGLSKTWHVIMHESRIQMSVE